MKVVIQRVSTASVTVAGKKISEIGAGLLIFLGIAQEDVENDINYLINKVAGLRIFKNESQNMNLSVLDINGEVMVVSQFTLCADTRRGLRPSFVNAAEPKMAEDMYNQFCLELQLLNIPVSRGLFGAGMDVKLVNDGPVTILLDSHI